MTVAAASSRRAPDADRTRRTILGVVEDLLAQGGEAAVSIREICLRAAVTPPTIYHHFGDKQSLINRVVDDCFTEFDRSIYRRRGAAHDPVEALRVGFDRYVDYGVKHPSHYKLMFQHPVARPTPAGIASYNRFRASIAAVEQAGRLRVPVADATLAMWSAAHGVTSMLIAGFGRRDDRGVILVRDSVIAHLTTARAQTPIRKKGDRA